MNKMLQNQVAIYCRLSREDGDSFESSSITSQKEMLTEYAINRNWSIFNIYVDDGYSGGNFNRPAFKQMLSDIENGKINIVITKDLSRLGRNYILNGYYIEEYFPKMNIRYIAINDNYDSNNGEDDMAPFKSIFNQYYLRDLSKKSRAAHLSRIKKGLLPIGNNIPLFGYKNVDGKREIEPQCARTIKVIFKLYNDGKTMKEISSFLYENKYITPSYYCYQNYNYNPSIWLNAKDDQKYIWTRGMIGKVLAQEDYTGKLTLLINKVVYYKTHQKLKTKEDERFIYDDMSLKIIDEETFEKAKKRRLLYANVPLSEEINRYKGFIYCANCKKPMSVHHSPVSKRRKTESIKYICRNKLCNKHVSVEIKKLDKEVMAIVYDFFQTILKLEETIRKIADEYKGSNDEADSINKELRNLDNRNDRLNNLMQSLFERNFNGELPKVTYDKILNNYKSELNDNLKKISDLKSKLQNEKKVDYLNEFNIFVKEIKTKTFNLENIKKIVNCIYVSRVNRQAKYTINVGNITDLIKRFLDEE